MMKNIKPFEQQILTILGIYKTKFTILNELIQDSDIEALHIDITSLIKILNKLNDKFEDDRGDYSLTIASSIINLAAHMRLFLSRKNMDTTIYLYYQNTKDCFKGVLGRNIKDALTFIQTVSDYIPKLYMIWDENNYDDEYEIRAIDHFIRKHSDKTNYIITKDITLFQFTIKKISKAKVKILRVARDNSYVVTSKNVYQSLIKDNNAEYHIPNRLLGSLLTITGSRYGGVKGIGIKKGIRLFEKACIKERLHDINYSDIDEVLEALELDCQDVDKLQREYDHTDLRLILAKRYNNKKYDSMLRNKYGGNDLKNINNTYFSGFNYLMVDELLMESVESDSGWKKSKSGIRW